MIRPRATLAPLATLALLAGCGTADDDLGMTNGPPPVVSGETPAYESDTSGPPMPDVGEPAGMIGDAETTSGTAGRGGGQNSGYPEEPQAAGKDVIEATPPAIDAPAEANPNGTPESPE